MVFFLSLFIFRSYCTTFYQPALHKSNIKFGCFCNLFNRNSHLKERKSHLLPAFCFSLSFFSSPYLSTAYSCSNNVIIISTTSFSRSFRYSANTSWSLQMWIVSSTAFLVLPYNFTCSLYTFVNLTYWFRMSPFSPSYSTFTFTSTKASCPEKNSSVKVIHSGLGSSIFLLPYTFSLLLSILFVF